MATCVGAQRKTFFVSSLSNAWQPPDIDAMTSHYVAVGFTLIEIASGLNPRLSPLYSWPESSRIHLDERRAVFLQEFRLKDQRSTRASLGLVFDQH